MSGPDESADDSAVPTAGRRPEKLDVLPVSAAEAIRAAIRHSNTVSSQAGFQRDFPPWQKRARREPSALLQVHGFTVSHTVMTRLTSSPDRLRLAVHCKACSKREKKAVSL